MRSTQDKVLAQIEQAATTYGYEVVIDWAASNTGKLRIEGSGSFEPVLTFEFNFQTGYFSFDRVRPHLPEFPEKIEPVLRLPGTTTQKIGVWFPPISATPISTEEILKAIRNHLARIRQAEQAAEFA